jgi:hypothetical protein
MMLSSQLGQEAGEPQIGSMCFVAHGVGAVAQKIVAQDGDYTLALKGKPGHAT